MKKQLLQILILICLQSVNSVIAQSPGVSVYVSGIPSPIDVKNCGDERLFVADRNGRIWIINPDTTLRATPFLNITTKVNSLSGEQGFLGLAFSPAYASDRKFYVYYTGLISGNVHSIVEEYKASVADSNVADLSSALIIITQQQPAGLTNHKGGNLMFGGDGFLYINLGDGGGGGDPYLNGQNKNTLLGKMLRIDVSNSSSPQPYVIPSTNPFYNDITPGIRKEIWAYGLRNPWRNSIDRLTGDRWIADVGQGAREEINLERANNTGGNNFGWNIMEGTACYNPSSGCSSAGLTLPIYEYTHSVGQSITGGYVYRSIQSKSLFGTYIFADYVQKWVDGFKESGGVPGPVTRYITNAQATGNPISFGEDRYGDQYILFNGLNSVYKLQDTSSLRRPKAYITAISQPGGSYLLQGLQGRNVSYQWLKNNAPLAGETGPNLLVNSNGVYALKITNALNRSDTSDVFSFGTLAVNLGSFTAQRKSASEAELKWQTISEFNHNGFTIERRNEGESNFSTIGFVPFSSPGGSINFLQYSFTDRAAVSNKIFYRLRFNGSNGEASYSDIRIVSKKNGGGYVLFPNPARDRVTIVISDLVNPCLMTMYDIMGRKVMQYILSNPVTVIPLKNLKGYFILEFTGISSWYDKLLIQ